jgi:hypothetical protein
MVAYITRMPAGIPGDVNRAWHAVIEAQVVTPNGTTGAPTAYGLPMVVDATAGNVGNMRTVGGSDAVANVYGFLVRPFPTNSSQDGLGTSTPPASGVCNICRVGYMTILLNGTVAATKGGRVYIWTSASSGTHVLGGVEADSSLPGGSNGFALTGATFMGPADSSGNVEISFDCRIAD